MESNRSNWEFSYSAKQLMEAAVAQREHRNARVVWWQNKQEEIMAEIRSSGIEISESVAAGYSNTQGLRGPQVVVKPELQLKLNECTTKIQGHQRAATEYDGWVQVLANVTATLQLKHGDWLYFFGR